MNFNKLGIALAGGGGKGAYQIGVWNALRDTGLDTHIAAIAGTSVGALNGAMMAQGRYEQAERMWREVENHHLLTVESMAGLAQWLGQRTPPGHVLARLTGSAASKGLFKKEGLQAMIRKGVTPDLLARSAVPLTVTWHHGGDNRVVYHTLRDAAHVENGLLATAALPMIFDEVEIEHVRYSDGGFYWELPHRKLDNVPVRPLQDAGCDTVIVVCLSQDDLTVAPAQFPGMRIIPIVPRRALGGVLSTVDFSNDGALRRIEQGYEDGREILRHLDMFLDSGERYQQLWDEVARGAARAQAAGARIEAVDRSHGATVRNIEDFDRTVGSDDFSRPLGVGADDGAATPSSFELENAALLDELERSTIDANVERFLDAQRHDRASVETAVLDALAALAPVSGRAAGLREQGAVARLLGMLTGRSQKLAADNQRALAEGQYALLRLVNAVQRQGALSLEFSCTLQNRLQGALQAIARLGERHDQDLARVYRSMAGVYGRLRERLMQHGERLDALERQGRVHHWLLHPNRPRHRGLRLADMAPTLRLATLANDFFVLTGGKWSVEELLSAKEMCYLVGLDRTTVRVGGFFADLLGDHESRPTLVKSLVAQPQAAPAGAAGWLLELRTGCLAESVDHAAACWSIDADTELPAWDLLVETLYHMRAAGLAPIQHDSELTALKGRWTERLDGLGKLVAEGMLPPSFGREILPVRAAIEGFKLKVPLVGKFSTGKSTLVNRWLDQEVQEEDLGACTAVPVEFHHALPGQEKLVVHWAPVAPDTVAAPEEFADPYMKESRVLALAAGRTALYIERHCQLATLARHPDLIVVDTPGLGSIRQDHELALAQYLGEGVLFILCANRGQIGIEEQAFIRRQKQLGQEFSLLVCQEDLVNASERLALQERLAQQAGLQAGQLVRGCSAADGNLAGFDDLLAHVERRKSVLFIQRHRPMVEALVQRAGRLLALALEQPGAGALRERKGRIEAAMAELEQAREREEQALLKDCANGVAQAVVDTVRKFLQLRRGDYVEALDAKRDIAAMLQADAQNGFELAARQHFGARLQRSAAALEQQVDPGQAGDLVFGAAGTEFMKKFAATSFVAGSLIGGGLVVGGVVKLLGWYMRPSPAEHVDRAIRNVCASVEEQAGPLLDGQARLALAKLHELVAARLQSEREQADRIEEQLRQQAAQRQEAHRRATEALAAVRAMVDPDPDPEQGQRHAAS